MLASQITKVCAHKQEATCGSRRILREHFEADFLLFGAFSVSVAAAVLVFWQHPALLDFSLSRGDEDGS
jgi:hypothetical protein